MKFLFSRFVSVFGGVGEIRPSLPLSEMSTIQCGLQWLFHRSHSCTLPPPYPQSRSTHSLSLSHTHPILYLLIPLGVWRPLCSCLILQYGQLLVIWHTSAYTNQSSCSSQGSCQLLGSTWKRGTSIFCYSIPPNFSGVWSSLLNLSFRGAGNSALLFQTPPSDDPSHLPLPLLCTPKPEASGSWKTCSDSSNILSALSSLRG